MNKAETLYYGSQLYGCSSELMEWVENNKEREYLEITHNEDMEIEKVTINCSFQQWIKDFEEDKEWVEEVYDMIESKDYNFKYRIIHWTSVDCVRRLNECCEIIFDLYDDQWSEIVNIKGGVEC